VAEWRHMQRAPSWALFDNPVRDFSLDELAQTVRKLERERFGRTVEELSRAVFAELGRGGSLRLSLRRRDCFARLGISGLS
jgi:hypothetical protein